MERVRLIKTNTAATPVVHGNWEYLRIRVKLTKASRPIFFISINASEFQMHHEKKDRLADGFGFLHPKLKA